MILISVCAQRCLSCVVFDLWCPTLCVGELFVDFILKKDFRFYPKKNKMMFVKCVPVLPKRLIMRVRLTKSEVRSLYQDCALTSVSSRNDWKVPRKLLHVTNNSMSTENQIPKSVYCSASQASRGKDRLIKTVLDLKVTTVG